jgi:colanic acid biosynthesis glycosyl transferase WcaI
MSLLSDGKRILLVSPFFYPEEISTGKYNTYLAKALSKKGNSISVITSYPLYPDWLPKITNASIAGIKIFRGGLGVRYPKSQVLRRIVLEVWFAWHASKILFKQRKNVDLLVVIFPPVFFMVFINIFLSKEIPRIGIVHDLLGIMAISAKKRSRKIIARLIRSVEYAALGKCDHIVCLSESMRNVIVEKYLVPIKKCSVHYPFITSSYSSAKTNKLSSVFDGDHLHVVYSGALGEKQKPNELKEFFHQLCKSRADLKCHIFSRGPLFDGLKQYTSQNLNSRVYLHDLVPEEQLTELYERSTVHVIPQAEGVSAGAFPSKLPNLLAHGVPVFAICDESSELAAVVEKTKIGRHVAEWDMQILISQMNMLLNDIQGISHIEIRNRYENSLMDLFSVDSLVRTILQS